MFFMMLAAYEHLIRLLDRNFALLHNDSILEEQWPP